MSRNIHFKIYFVKTIRGAKYSCTVDGKSVLRQGSEVRGQLKNQLRTPALA